MALGNSPSSDQGLDIDPGHEITAWLVYPRQDYGPGSGPNMKLWPEVCLTRLQWPGLYPGGEEMCLKA